MNSKQSGFLSHIFILALAGVIMLISIEMSQAQSTARMPKARPHLAQANSPAQNNAYRGQVLKTTMPQRSLGHRLLDDTTLSYYHQFLGPKADGSTTTQTYNVFDEALDQPGTGSAPLQSFHAINLRHQLTTQWAVGATLSATNGYTDEVKNTYQDDGFTLTQTNSGKSKFYNARAYVALPAFHFDAGSLYTTLSYEAPTSSISKEDEMRFGWVASQSFALNLPDTRFSVGVLGQIYRMYYKNNVRVRENEFGQYTNVYQTMIVSGGPYANYRINDRWQVGSVITLDWDQRGVQSGSRDFNNNLPHRGRASLTYFPQKIKYLQSVGVFTQTLLKFSPGTTIVGADFSVKF